MPSSSAGRSGLLKSRTCGLVAGALCAVYVAVPVAAGTTLTLFSAAADAQVFEDQLGRGSTNAVKSFRRGVRKTYRTIVRSTQRWREWLPGILVVASMLLVVPAIDRGLFRTWRDQGFAAARSAFALGIAVYLRLIFDRRVPALPRLLLLFAAVYAVSQRDMIPDAIPPMGWMDDLIAIVLASRAFLRMCPDALIEEHARRAARRRAWSLRRRSGGQPLQQR